MRDFADDIERYGRRYARGVRLCRVAPRKLCDTSP